MTQWRAAVFDLGGVVLDWNPRHLYRKLYDDERAMEDFLGHVCDEEWSREQDRGRPFAEGTRVLQQLHPQYEELIASYYLRWEEMFSGPIQPTVEILRELDDRDIPLYAVTNCSSETFPVVRRRFDFLSLFRGIVVSGVERMAKPDPEIFRLTVARFGLDPAACIYVDDVARNVRAARAVGFAAVRFTDGDRLRVVLERLDLLPASVEGRARP